MNASSCDSGIESRRGYDPALGDRREENVKLQTQIEQISDEAPGDRISVIIQMDAGDGLRERIATATEVATSRRAVITARDLLDEVKRKADEKRSGATRRSSKRGGERKTGAEQATLEFSGKLPILLKSAWTRDRSAGTAPISFDTFGTVVMDVTKEELQRLTQHKHVAAVFRNRIVKRPPVSKAAQLPRAVLDCPGYTWGLARTGAMSCWGAYGATGGGVKVAILDTGIDAKHPDLKGKIDGFAEFDGDGNTLIDSVSKAYDSDGHGTHCAGTVVGEDESTRYIGMAPDARLYVGLVLKKGEGTDAQVLAGIQWAIANKVDVISMSLGGLSMTADVFDTYTLAIIRANEAGIPVVCAVGNDGSQTTGSPGNDIFAYTVGATDIDDRAAGFSGGRTQIIETSRYLDPAALPLVYSKPDITAPGVDVFSTVPKGKHEAWNGSSMATPHVAGAMALLLSSKAPLLAGAKGIDRVDLIQTILSGTVKELGEAGQNHRFGYGRLDVLRAIGFAWQEH
jgi:subtilisin family serine protease